MRALWSAAIAASLFACGPDETQNRLCGEESRADTYVDGLMKPTAAGTYQVALMSTMVEGTVAVPDRGQNVWTLRLTDPAAAPIDDATIKLKSWMPDHGHGTSPNNISATMKGSGAYEIGPFNLFMGGLWEFTFTVDRAGATDTAKFAFCVEG
jgi:hypothetical protein